MLLKKVPFRKTDGRKDLKEENLKSYGQTTGWTGAIKTLNAPYTD